MLLRWRNALGIVAIALTAVAVWGVKQRTSGEDRVAVTGATTHSRTDSARAISRRERDEALARTQIWSAPQVPVAAASFAIDPSQPQELSCRFDVSELGGTTSLSTRCVTAVYGSWSTRS